MSPAIAIADAVRAAIGYQAQGEPAGNLAIGRGALRGRVLRAAVIESRIASGSLGVLEAEKLGALFRVAAREHAPLVLCIDSAGARVSEGLRALGAFRTLFAAGLDAAYAGVPMVAALGRNCYGGASMLAHLAGRRLFSPTTQLAMSGPAIIAATAGTTANDEAYRAMAEASMSPAARAAASPANVLWSPGDDLPRLIDEALAPSSDPAAAFRFRHESLGARIERRAADAPWEVLRRRDLERLYPEGYEARESQGLLEGHGRRGGSDRPFLGIAGKVPLGVARAWRFSELAWRHTARPPAALDVFLDCASHAPRLEDERAVLTEFIVDMSLALAALRALGTRLTLTVLGKAGGGVYVALAAPMHRVASVHGADIQVLPGSAVAAILGESREDVPSFEEYRASGVADEEIKPGFVPGTA